MSLITVSKSFQQSLVSGCVVVTLLCGFASVLNAQDASLPYDELYKIVEVDNNDKDRRQKLSDNREAKNAIRDAERAVGALLLSGGKIATPETAQFFDGYVWPSMTKPEKLTDAGLLRYDFKRDFISKKYPIASRRSFIETVAIPGLQNLIDNKNLAPAARVNAVVLMGQLDEAPLNRSANAPPRPSLNAFQALGKIWQGDYPSFLKVVAFSGLNRHVEIDQVLASPRIPSDQKSQLMATVLAQMEQIINEDPQLEVDIDRWQVGKSIEMLSKSGLTSDAAKFADRFNAMLAEDSLVPKWTKLEAIRGLNRLPLNAVAADKVDAMIDTATAYLGDALAGEADAIQSSVDELIYDNILWRNEDLEITGTDYTDANKMSDDMGMGMGMDELSMDMGTTQGMRPGDKPAAMVELPNFELNLSRRRMKLIGYTVQQFLRKDAIQNRASAVNKKKLEKLDRTLSTFLNEDSNVGLVDRSKMSAMQGSTTQGSASRDAVPKSIAMQLKETCLRASTEVNRLFGDGEAPAAAAVGGVPAAAAPAAPEKPAASSDQPF